MKTNSYLTEFMIKLNKEDSSIGAAQINSMASEHSKTMDRKSVKLIPVKLSILVCLDQNHSDFQLVAASAFIVTTKKITVKYGPENRY